VVACYDVSRQWQCTANCNMDALGTTVSGTGQGSNRNSACIAAKRDANSKVPAGAYKRHCKCDCWR
jgi:hypothetical protein